MCSIKKNLILACAVAAAVAAPSAFATNGYFSLGYGAKARGMGGAGIAFPQDSLAAATNPAGMAHIDSRADLGLEWFNPNRSAKSAYGGVARSSESGSDNFYVPGGGYVTGLGNKKDFIGVSVYGNGGMNTDYAPDTSGNVNLFGYNDQLGVNLAQLMTAPTWARKLTDQHTVGVSLVLAYQMFEAYGLQNFCSLKASGCGTGAGSSVGNSNLTNQGKDTAFGYGLRLGWLGQVTPEVSLGATYATRIDMDKLDKYKELFAEQGDFDIPANYGIGAAFKVAPAVTLAADVVRIKYSDVKSIANHGPTTAGASVFAEGQGMLGTDNGLGFGWRDMTVYKFGVHYKHSDSWIFRAGYNYGKQPIAAGEATFNILAPAVVEEHLTLGFTHSPSKGHDLTVAFKRVLENSLKGDFPVAFGGTSGANQTELKMDQNALEASYSWNF
jgi:long-chain fatty acid transport protein